MIVHKISKILSANDAGETGGHQAGLLIPKEKRILSFFPKLEISLRNPRSHLQFKDDTGRFWMYSFIYYNNKFFGGTRNEYRLTRMTKYIRESGLRPGDEIVMSQDHSGNYTISYRRIKEQLVPLNEQDETVIKLGTDWKVIEF